MIVVSDATPINHLTRAGIVHILPEIFRVVIVPEAVHRELQADETPAEIRDLIDSGPAWLEVRQASLIIDSDLDYLDRGEREAIILSEDLNADFLLMDEKKGRRIALDRKLPVIGTIGLLEKAAFRGIIDFRNALAALKASGFYLSRELEADYLDRFSPENQ